MSSSLGRVGLGLAGGIIGFFAGGPLGAARGFALGFVIASAVFPPDFDENTTAEDPFQVTTATEGTPVEVIFGRRRVRGNIIWFDYSELNIREITPDGKGKGFGKGADTEFGTYAYAPVAIGICVGRMTNLIGIYNSKNEDWQAINTSNGGAPIQISSPPTEIDFAYGPKEPTTQEPKSSPIKGITSGYSKKLFLGQNTRNMQPLTFDLEITCSPEAIAFCGSPTAGMPAGCINPAHIYYEICTDKQAFLTMDESWLDQTAFQAARQLFEDEGLGLAPRWSTLTSGRKMLDDLNFHTRSIIRPNDSGAIELFPIRDRSPDWVLPELHCYNESVSGRSWRDVPNIFTCTFPDKDTDVPFTQRTLNLKNEAALDISGRRVPKSYNFPHITDKDVALWRLELQKRYDSYPLSVMSVEIPVMYHKVRVGDVIAVTHSKFDFVDFNMRVQEVTYPEFEGMDIKVKLLQEIPLIEGQFLIPIADPIDPPLPEPDPVDPECMAHSQEHWRSRISGPDLPPPWFPPTDAPPREEDKGGPVYGPDTEEGYFGYPFIAAAARGKSSDIGFGFKLAEGLPANLPNNEQGNSIVIGRAHCFVLEEELKAGDWTPAIEGHGIAVSKVKYSENDVFDLPDQDGVNVDGVPAYETSPYVMLIGNYEYCRWGRSLDLGNGNYIFEKVMRGANKTRLLSWPAGTLVTVFKLRRPVVPDGLSNYLDWGHRPRHISHKEWRDGRRLRMFVQGVSYAQKIQPFTDGLVQTFEFVGDADPLKQTGIVQPREVLEANKAPTPAAQGIVIGKSEDTDRAWYPLTVVGAGNMEIQFQPFSKSDWDGIGDRIVSDSELIEEFGPEPYLPTDLEDYDDYLTNVDGGRHYGMTYRLRVWEDKAAWDAQDAPVITKTVSTTLGGSWPHLSLTQEEVAIAGGSMAGSPMAVDVLTSSDRYSPPQFISKLGVWDTTGLGLNGGGSHSPLDEYPQDT